MFTAIILYVDIIIVNKRNSDFFAVTLFILRVFFQTRYSIRYLEISS
nr:MAG TPA: hypothetical protein [Caudoviricetes sp.]